MDNKGSRAELSRSLSRLHIQMALGWSLASSPNPLDDLGQGAQLLNWFAHL